MDDCAPMEWCFGLWLQAMIGFLCRLDKKIKEIKMVGKVAIAGHVISEGK